MGFSRGTQVHGSGDRLKVGPFPFSTALGAGLAAQISGGEPEAEAEEERTEYEAEHYPEHQRLLVIPDTNSWSRWRTGRAGIHEVAPIGDRPPGHVHGLAVKW